MDVGFFYCGFQGDSLLCVWVLLMGYIENFIMGVFFFGNLYWVLWSEVMIEVLLMMGLYVVGIVNVDSQFLDVLFVCLIVERIVIMMMGFDICYVVILCMKGVFFGDDQ